MMTILKSIGAILVGLIVGAALSIGTDFVFERIGVFPSFAEQMEEGFFMWWKVLLATIYRSIYAIIGSYVAANLAPNRPMLHAMILGVIGFIANIAGGYAMREFAPHWYPIALTLLALPCAWLGGWFGDRQAR
jgi:hypothetical protein